jgi:hypothetical protein
MFILQIHAQDIKRVNKNLKFDYLRCEMDKL